MLGLLGFLAFIAFILGPIGFFLSLGVRPRITELENVRGKTNDRLFQTLADFEQRLRRIEQRLEGTASLPSPASPEPALPTETSASIGEAAAAAVPAALATAAPSE